MTELRQWAAVDGTVIVHGGFDAPQEYVDDYVDRVVDRADLTTPPWWHEGVEFLDVTGMTPRPMVGWFRVGNGPWMDGNPSLTASRLSIPADSTTAAVVTFAQKGPNAPASVEFNVNGVKSTVALANDTASVEVVSATAGDLITVAVGSLSVQVEVQ